ncbi:MAG: hypothetical protein JSV46_07775 [Candidatus Aminicenantes bacterium]|nr:MAG: hypothetical protein JSV46_07775 [Candidatus Aminicenantes bacterium]
MESEKRKEENAAQGEQIFEPLPSIVRGEDITLRDDLYDFSVLLDSVKVARQRGIRFRLIDTGKLDRFQLEWLAEAGADLYTSDDARTDAQELELVNKACRKGKAICAYIHNGPLEAEEGSESISYSSLQDLGRDGIYIHLTNRQNERDSLQLNELAFACQRGGSWLVYYHFGSLEFSLEELAMNGAWVHTSEQIFKDAEDKSLIVDNLKAAISAGLRYVLHVEKGLDISLLDDLMRAGAFILFKFSLFDRKSPFRALEKKARRKKPDFRAYYLYPNILP